MGDNIKITWLPGTKRLAPLEYFTRDMASLPTALLLGMHAAEAFPVKIDAALPAGVLECRSGGDVLSRLWLE